MQFGPEERKKEELLFGCWISRDAHQINNVSSGRRDADVRESERSKDAGVRERILLLPGEEKMRRA